MMNPCQTLLKGVRLTGSGGHRRTGFAGLLVAPPEGEAPQALRGWV